MTKLNGKEPTLHIRQYDTMADAERQAFQKMVEEGGEVDPRGLLERVKAAYLLAYVAYEDRLIGVGAIKRPADSYVQYVSDRSGYDLKGYFAELGWIYISTAERKRGLAYRISEKLCESYGSPMFATTRIDNIGMQRILGKLGFAKKGRQYDSVEHPGIKIQVWVKSA